jgi:hypothetical protein
VPFSPEEDKKLSGLVARLGADNWPAVTARMPRRTLRQCRERYVNYLAPGLNTRAWTPEEDQLLLETQHEIGPLWTAMQGLFPNRTDSMLKNRFHVLKRKRQADRTIVRPETVFNEELLAGDMWENWEMEMPASIAGRGFFE